MSNEYKFVITGKDATKRAFSAIRKNLGSVRAGINSTQVKVAGLAGVAGFGALVNKSLKSGDALAKFSDRVGATTEGLAGLQLITELNGESSESLSKSLEKMNRGVGEAQRGIGTALPAFKELGLDIDEISKLPADERFIKIGSAIGSLEDETLQASLASDIFGRSGIKLINTFEQGEEAMRAAKDQAAALGIAMSRTDAAKIEAANDAMLLASKRVEGIGNQVTVAVAPIIAELADQFTAAGLSSDEMTEVIKKGLNIGTGIVGTFADGIHGVNILFKAGEVAGRGLGTAIVGSLNFAQTKAFEFWNSIKQFVLEPIQSVLELAAPFSTNATNALAQVNTALQEVKPPPGLGEMFDQMSAGFNTAKNELNDLVLEEIPSQIIGEKLQAVLDGAQARAEAIAAKAQTRLDTPVDDSETAGLDEREQEKLQTRLDRLNEGYATELDQLRTKLQTEQTILTESLNANLLTEERFKALNIRAEKKFAAEKSKLEEKSAADRRSKLFSSLSSIANMFGGQSKKMFKLQKTLALAEAAVTLPPAIISSYKNAGGFPLGIPAAAAMAVQGAAQIASIKRSSLGSAGSITRPGGSSVSGGVSSISSAGAVGSSVIGGLEGFSAANDASSQTKAATEIHFHLPEGVVLGSDAEKNLIDMRRLIVEEDFELIPTDSRNGIDLAAGLV